MIGKIDNSRQSLDSAELAAIKVPFHVRLHGRLRGRRPPLYKNAGIHLKLPKPYNHVVYVYIRKNGCSAFKRWFLDDMGERRGPEAQISLVAERYAVSMEWELAGTKRLLVLRDPVDRTCSLFRNKFIQRKGAEDIQDSFKDVTGTQGGEASFKYFVKNYLQPLLRKGSRSGTKIDPHCVSQSSHLYPISYDQVIMLDDLPKASRHFFSEDVASFYFSHRVNSTPSAADSTFQSETPASKLIQRYESCEELPDNESLVDKEICEIIQSIYQDDYDLISQAFKLQK